MDYETLSQLGNRILIIVDCDDACVQMFKQLVHAMPDIEKRRFTLFHFIPTTFWEHGGDPSPKARQAFKNDSTRIWEVEEHLHHETEDYFTKVQTVLEDAHVPTTHIKTRSMIHPGGLTSAIIDVLKQDTFTGVILSCRHVWLARILQHRSLFKWLMGNIPATEVYVVEAHPVTA